MWLDTLLTIRKQVETVCGTVSTNTALIRCNGKYLSLESCRKLVSGLVMAILDKGNALYFGFPKKELNKLQRLQNYTAKTKPVRNRNYSISCF